MIGGRLANNRELWHCTGQMPDVYRDSDNGLQYVTTKGGNKVVVGEDSVGRVYFIDATGNFYYDTGSSDLGFYVVSLLPELLAFPHSMLPMKHFQSLLDLRLIDKRQMLALHAISHHRICNHSQLLLGRADSRPCSPPN